MRGEVSRLGLIVFFCAESASAVLPPAGEPIKTNDYSIDLFQGPVLAGTRVTGLAGAFVAMAQGVDGDSQNPASPAVRSSHARTHFDYDLGIGLTFPSSLANSDFFNSGQQTSLSQSGFVFLGLAANLTLGRWGLGITTDLQRYRLNRGDGAVGVQREELEGTIAIGHLILAHAFADGQFVVGVGARTTSLDVNNASEEDAGEQSLFSSVGSGVETGFVWKPNDRQFRVGAAFRSEVTTEASPDSRLRVAYPGDPVNELWLPNEVSLPWDFNVGFAVQFGPRPLNPRFVNPDELLLRVRRYLDWRKRERERRERIAMDRARREGRDPNAARAALASEHSAQAALDEAYLSRAEQRVDRQLALRYESMHRFFVRVMGSLLVSGPAENAVGVESFLERTVQRSGQNASYSPRIALETEPIAHWLRLRAGSYWEPTRFREGEGRLHGTFGLDQKLLPWSLFGLFPDETIWRATGAIDAADGYFGWGVAVGVWH